jgi:hypothetical protein
MSNQSILYSLCFLIGKKACQTQKLPTSYRYKKNTPRDVKPSAINQNRYRYTIQIYIVFPRRVQLGMNAVPSLSDTVADNSFASGSPCCTPHLRPDLFLVNIWSWLWLKYWLEVKQAIAQICLYSQLQISETKSWNVILHMLSGENPWPSVRKPYQDVNPP